MNHSTALPTSFAPAERSAPEEVQRQTGVVNDERLKFFLNSVPDILMVLNQHRQLVYTNRSLLTLLGLEEAHSLFGLRPGEVFNCIHASETEGGCGTTEYCSTCGAVRAILQSQQGTANSQECRILQKDTGQAFDLRVWATPIDLEGQRYTIFAISDISDEKRRIALERIFFHDVLNTAGGLLGVSELLQDATPAELDELKEMFSLLSEDLVRQITAQRDLTLAEANELKLKIETLSASSLLRDTQKVYQHNLRSRGCVIKLNLPAEDISMRSDKTLMLRVLGNLTKNALEASEKNTTITLGVRRVEADAMEFFVHNPAVMPREAQLQVFQRSYSTKGRGRGLGTYSIRLLSERYLQGQVRFTSNAESGTTFYACYPLRLAEG